MGFIVLKINRLNKAVFWVSVIALQALIVPSAQAKIYKCTNIKGAIYYNDKPCPIKDEEKIMKAEKDVLNGYKPSVPAIQKTHSFSSKSNAHLMKGAKKNSVANNSEKLSEEKIDSNKAINNNKASAINSNSINLTNSQLYGQQKSSDSEKVNNKEPQSMEEMEQLFIDTRAGEVSGPENQ